jgi:hypothetical protein
MNPRTRPIAGHFPARLRPIVRDSFSRTVVY